jgi:hypothetical protein
VSEHEAPGAADRAHSKYGGSVIGRVIACAGSVALCDTIPPEPESSYAAEGTFAHLVAEYCLKEGKRDASPLAKMSLPMGYDDKLRIVGPEVADGRQRLPAAVYAELDASPNAELYVEHGFALDVASAEPGEVFGTNDAMVYHPDTGRLVVFDYKHGAGVRCRPRTTPS